MNNTPLPVVSLAEASSRGIDAETVKLVKSMMTLFLNRDELYTGSGVDRYIRRAIRNGVWGNLGLSTRVLLVALRKWSGVVKSPTLRRILVEIYVEIELYTTRGRALFYGILIAMNRAHGLLYDISSNLTKIMVMGLQYVNLPRIHRIYG